MKTMVLAAAALVAAATPAFAQAQAAADHSTHGEASAKLTLDSPIAAIAADEKGKAALDANLPGLTSHPQYEMFKGMSLNQIAPMAGDKIPAEALAKLSAALAEIK